jgi:hypothetical protein
MSNPSPTLSPAAWCESFQLKVMAALEAAWATIETSNDAAVLKLAREKARVCGVMAATARRVVAMVPPPRPAARPAGGLPAIAAEPAPAERPVRAIDRLKGGRRGRL